MPKVFFESATNPKVLVWIPFYPRKKNTKPEMQSKLISYKYSDPFSLNDTHIDRLLTYN